MRTITVFKYGKESDLMIWEFENLEMQFINQNNQIMTFIIHHS
jgi:hypothetical protein